MTSLAAQQRRSGIVHVCLLFGLAFSLTWASAALQASALQATALQAAERPETATRSGPGVERPIAAPAGPPLGGDDLERATVALGKEMRCPVCQGSSIADSPSQSARNMLDEVQQLLAEGYSKEQVLVYFEGRYGEFVRLRPKASGFNLLVWLLPLLGLVLGAVMLANNLRSGLRQPESAGLDAYRERALQESARVGEAD